MTEDEVVNLAKELEEIWLSHGKNVGDCNCIDCVEYEILMFK